MSQSWEEFIVEALSMLGYGFAPHEIVYKKRQGPRDEDDPIPGSRYDDGKIGIRKLPIRAQDTVLKWFLGEHGEILGLTQLPYTGGIIDIPMRKLLLFRPSAHKGNPEGKSILRNCYLNYYFIKRLQEHEAILFERMGGLPVLKVPSSLLEAAEGGDPAAVASLNTLKKVVVNVRIDEQMGLVLPSDHYTTAQGAAGAPQYDFSLVTPQSGTRSSTADAAIQRHKLDIATSMLADFLSMGHEARGRDQARHVHGGSRRPGST